MVKPPRIRHSKARRDPVTIDLDPKDVSRREAAEKPDADTQPQDSAKAEAEAAAEATTAEAEDTSGAADAKAVYEEKAGTGAFGRAGSSQEREPSTSQTPPADEPRRSAGVAAAIAAGIVGGLVAVAVAGGLQYAGFLPSPRVEEAVPIHALDAIEAEIARLQQQFAAAGSTADGDAVAAAVHEANARLDALSDELEAIKGEVSRMASAGAADNADTGPAIEALQGRLTELEQRVVAQPQNGEAVAADVLETLEPRLSDVERSSTSAADAASAAQQAASAAQEAAASVRDRLDAVEAEIRNVREDVEEQAESPRIALAIAAAGLKSAIDRGTPFMAELETYAAVAPDAPEIAALRDLAAAGVPTRTQIGTEVAEVASAMVRSTHGVDEEAGFIDRLYSSARSLVTVRPIGEAEGESVPATVARMEAAIRQGNYAMGISEFETLPQPVQAVGADFIAKVRARMTADELIDRALAGALRA
jgi:hypothetical protein